MEPRKWSWTEFIIGFINKKFIVFVVITMIVRHGLFDGLDDSIKKILIIIWGVVAVTWMLSGALETLISNGKFNVDAKLGASISK